MVVDPAGPACPCGRRGCWERFASGAGLGRLGPRGGAGRPAWARWCALAGGDPESVRGEDVSAAAARGRPGGAPGHREVGWWVGFGLANLACRARPRVLRAGGRGGPGRRPPGRRRPRHLRRARRGRRTAAPPRSSCRPPSASGPAPWARALRRRARAACGDADRRRPAHLPRHARRGASTAAAEAVAAGVDGLFCYDHLWPMGQPERPALAPFPVLGALATRLGRPSRTGDGPFLGTLVARVGLVPNAVLAAQFVALDAAGPGAGHRRAGHRRPAERAGEPGLRHPLRPGGRAPRRAGGAGSRPAWPAGLTVVGGRRARGADRGGRAPRARHSTVWDADAGAGGGAGRRPRRARGHLGRAAAARAAPTAAPSMLPLLHRARGHLGGVRVAGRRRGAGGRRDAPSARAHRREGRWTGRRLPRWSSAGSTGCRPTSSPPSTT